MRPPQRRQPGSAEGVRYRVLRLYRQLNHRNTIAVFREVQDAFPFPIRPMQTDNGNEFSWPSG